MKRNLVFSSALLAIGFMAGWNFKPSGKPALLSIENPQVSATDAIADDLLSPDQYTLFPRDFSIPWRESLVPTEFDFEIKTVPTNNRED